MRRGRRKAASKDKVFGCDLLEHLAAASQEIPQVLRSCSEFIEEYGIVDGIYRLSGVSSNTQKLRGEFDIDGVPDLSKDVYLQDIHCVSSLCKAYFRELPNPLLTYQLYDKFADAVAIQLEEERLVKIRDVLKDLPVPHYRTLEYLMRHLVKMATFASETNMHARNLAIVWAPNLLRSKDIEATGLNGTAAFMEVRVQSIVVEFILTHVSQLFPIPGQVPERRKSLPSPSILSNQEDPFFRAIPFNVPSTLSPGNGPPAMRPYHAIIEGTDKRKGSLKGRKWKSIFNLGGRLQDPRRKNKTTGKEKEKVGLRPAKSMDSLSSVPYTPEGTRQHPAASPLTQPPPAPSGETGPAGGGLGGAGSGYAVTYRRGGGACVSVVSGGGVQGTYSRLDSGGEHHTDGQPPQPRSPALASRAERRAGMHISGPISVTVPLHITSGLVLGGALRQGEGAGNRDGAGARVEEGAAPKDEAAANGDGDGGGARRDSGGGPHPEENGKARAEEEGQGEESGKARAEEEGQGEEGREGGAGGKESAVTRLEEGREAGGGEEREKEETEPAEAAAAEEDLDYVDMKGISPREEQDSQLPLDFQDTFGFLDLMDSSAYNQVNEFSVEPPCYEEMDDDDEESGYPGHSSLMLTPERPLQPPRPLTPDPQGNSACKSLSLPYKSRPFLAALSSSSSGEDDDEDEEEGSDEEEDIMFYSLPSSLLLQAGIQGEAETHKMAENAGAHPTARPGQDTDAHSSPNARSRANAFSQSEGEHEHSPDMDWLLALARPREMVEHDGSEEEDSLELRKQTEEEEEEEKEEEEETPANTTNGERDHPVALTNDAHELGCAGRESGFVMSEEDEEYEEDCGKGLKEEDHTSEHSAPEQREGEHTEPKERDHAAEHTEPKERDHTSEHTESKERDHTAEHTESKEDHAAEHTESKERDHISEQTEPKERDHTAEHTESKERDHTSEQTELKERDHTAEHTESKEDHISKHTEPKERDHTAEHTESKEDHTSEHTESKERDHTAEHTESKEDHTSEHTEPKERDHTAERTEPKERDHTAEHTESKEDHTSEHTEPKERDHTAEQTEPKERDHTAEHTESKEDHTSEHTEPKERDHAAERTEPKERDHAVERTEPKERDHAAERTEPKERDHAAERTEPKEGDHATERSSTEHREAPHRKIGPGGTADSHHGSPEGPEGCHGYSVNGPEPAAELMECTVSPEACPPPLPETPLGSLACPPPHQEPPAPPAEGGSEKAQESHQQPAAQEKEGKKEQMEERQERSAVTSGGPEEGRGGRDLRTPQKDEAQRNARERDEERNKGGEEDREQGARQGKSEREREGRCPGPGPGVARALVYSKQATPKLHQAKAVPVVPPKPQQCKLTALTLRQQRERERGEGEREEQRRREAEREREKDGDTEGESERWGDEGRSAEKDTRRNSGGSVCFDVAVARATEKRGRERERGKDGQMDGRRGAEKD
ncbi:rho GTPase-activating protein 30 [Conger conger]|uniref:rho GTPase-activating protein 30 n=1 Tax=Conger conger TaxID=82655 RepID=UPI002A59E933|nr:rho GTPase-activating protein 30 [Conger conger]